LMVGVAQESPEKIARILDIVRPLFPGSAWPEIAALVAEEMAEGLAAFLHELILEALDDGELAQVLGEVRRDLARLRPALAGTPGWVAMELLLDCRRPGRRRGRKKPRREQDRGPRLPFDVP